MNVLKLTRWILFSVLLHISFTASQSSTIEVLVHFGSGPDLASVVAADSDAVTYFATHTNICRSGPCSPLTIYTNIMINGPSTAARTNIGGTASQTIECNITSSLMTGTCMYVGSVSISNIASSAFPMSSDFFWWEGLNVTAGLEKLSSLPILTTTGVVTTNIAPSVPTAAASTFATATPNSSTSSGSLSLTTTVSRSSAVSSVGSGSSTATGILSTAYKGRMFTNQAAGAAAGCQTAYLNYAMAGLAGAVVVALYCS